MRVIVSCKKYCCKTISLFLSSARFRISVICDSPILMNTYTSTHVRIYTLSRRVCVCICIFACVYTKHIGKPILAFCPYIEVTILLCFKTHFGLANQLSFHYQNLITHYTLFTKTHVTHQYLKFDNENSQKQKLIVWCILDTHPSAQATPLRT